MERPSLVGVFVVFLALSGVFRLVEGHWPRGRDRWTDVGYWFFTPMAAELVVRGAIIVLVLAMAVLSGAAPTKEGVEAFVAGGRLARLPAGYQFLIALAAGDLVGYWLRRLFHGPLWRFHAVHHSSETLDWLASVRVHPVNELVTKLTQVFSVLTLGLDPRVFAAYGPVLILYALLLHADVDWDYGPLKKVLASPTFHRWHHTTEREGLNKNFAGFFPLIDIVFGTYYMPEGRKPERFGTLGERVPEGLWAQLLFPFRART